MRLPCAIIISLLMLLVSNVGVALLWVHKPQQSFFAPPSEKATSALTTESAATQTGVVNYCPKAEQLIKKGMWWGAPGGWKSYAQSFVGSIKGFVGAQWAGVNVGIIICIYQASNIYDFPVTVQNSTLVHSPVGGMWGSYINGRKNCISNDVAGCPFIVPKVVQPENVYQELDFFKNNTVNSNVQPQKSESN